ncbi:hypothetical protein [Rhodococcus globerulus]|uniref:hypothetical protein n=1 Tax=Rhodococcus globerulus TaxID=33008 RepID=UPI001C58C63C|nr:hypothetical protein [Rhodococcus globerulus]QXW04026.1 hypothetical protein KYT97_08405 [Rhodococcus globerulus]
MLELIIFGLFYENDWDLTQPQATLLAGVISGALLIAAAYIAFHGQREQRAAERRIHEEQIAEQRRKASSDLAAQRAQLVEQLDAQRSQFMRELESKERMWRLEADRSAALVLRNEYVGMFTSCAENNSAIVSSMMNAERHHSNGDYDKALASVGETAPLFKSYSGVLVLSASDLVNKRYAEFMAECAEFNGLFGDTGAIGIMSLDKDKVKSALKRVRAANQRFDQSMRDDLERLVKQGIHD